MILNSSSFRMHLSKKAVLIFKKLTSNCTLETLEVIVVVVVVVVLPVPAVFRAHVLDIFRFSQ